jgi:tetratricopeptide (TPR) repeat protein
MLKRAIALDPNFATAYAAVGVSYANLGETGIASQYLQKAYELRDHASELERIRITTFYYDVVTGELPKELEAYELLVQARSAYQNFLTLWKDADPDIPILKQAKAEYAKLQ